MTAHAAEARIIAVVRGLAFGCVSSYGVVAELAGLPRRARLVARVLAHQTDDSLPWHRVVRSNGQIAFPLGSTQNAEQKRRLQAEGHLIENNRIKGKSMLTLDEYLWG